MQIQNKIRNTALAGLLLGSLAFASATKAAPFDTPVGVWDFVTSGGGQSGLAVLTFEDDGSFSGYQVLAPLPPKKTSKPSARGSYNSGRGNPSSPSTAKTNSFVYGFSPISGPWTFDAKGRVIGFYTQIINVTTLTTNYLPNQISVREFHPTDSGISTNLTIVFTNGAVSAQTNITWFTPAPTAITYTYFNTNAVLAVASAEKTNAISFTGMPVPGRRFNMVASTSYGKVNYKGIPLRATRSLTGDWVGTKKRGSQTFYEFFTLEPYSEEYPNVYMSTFGVGPGYTLSGGRVIISNQKQIGFKFTENDRLRATAGSYSTRRITSAKTKGIAESEDLKDVVGITFDAFLQTPL